MSRNTDGRRNVCVHRAAMLPLWISDELTAQPANGLHASQTQFFASSESALHAVLFSWNQAQAALWQCAIYCAWTWKHMRLTCKQFARISLAFQSSCAVCCLWLLEPSWELLCESDRKNAQTYEQVWPKKRTNENPNRVYQTNRINSLPRLHKVSYLASFEGPVLRNYGTKRKRWLSSVQKGALMGIPVNEIAAKMRTSTFSPSEHLIHGHQCIGNAMHVGNVAGVILSALLSIKLCAPHASRVFLFQYVLQLQYSKCKCHVQFVLKYPLGCSVPSTLYLHTCR